MVSRCANPSCEAQFKHLRDGRLFRFPVPKSAANLLTSGSDFRLWWLCAECSKTMTLIQDGPYGVKLVPLSSYKSPPGELDPTGSE